MMKSSSGVSLFLMMLIGMIVVVGAVTWNGSNVNYYLDEDTSYYHNLSANITGFSNDITFEMAGGLNKVNWTNSSGSYLVAPTVVSDWISITDSSTGNLTIDTIYDNQTGFFIVPIKALNSSGDDTITDFEFQINSTNDYPKFVTDLGEGYNWTTSADNFTVIAADEESHVPFDFTLTSVNCTHADFTGIVDDVACDIFTLYNTSSTTANIGLDPNNNGNHTGVYVFNLSISEADHTCPHDYCDSSIYETNLINVSRVTLTVLSSLSINVSNCTGQVLTEDTPFNCVVNITTVGATDSVDVSTFASFRADSDYSLADNSSWFYANKTKVATDNIISIPISVTPRKEDVGNWTINFSADDGGVSVDPGQILLYVNWTEETVSLDSISNLTGDNAVYENHSFAVSGYDNDLLILDNSVKDEQLVYDSNTSWVSVSSPISSHFLNYTTSTVSINFDYANDNGFWGNNSVLINVTDVDGSVASQVFKIEISNDTAPEWSPGLSDPVVVSLTEGSSFYYNVSMNISDVDEDALTFYYSNVSADFCSMNSSTFNSTTGVVNFTPVDCDVGYHNVTIVVGDGKLNSTVRQFNFTVDNLADAPVIANGNPYIDDADDTVILEGGNETLLEGVRYSFVLIVNDDDFLIPSDQESFYNESLTVDVIVTNSTGSDVDLFEFSFIEFGPSDESVTYNVSFTPSGTQVDNFTVLINITDESSSSIDRSFYLNITETFNAPNLTAITNQSFTVHDYLNFTADASDDEDDRDGLDLAYSIVNLSEGSPNLTIGGTSGFVTFDFDSNESYAGIWDYNITVTDSNSQTDTKVVYVYVYGNQTLVSPAESFVFNVTENVATVLNFTINHSIANNLTYEFWVDSISCAYQNNSNCTYGNSSLRGIFGSYGNGSAYNWALTPTYTDETYTRYKNLTVMVYPNATSLNSTQLLAVASNFSFKLNVSHTNAPVTLSANIPNPYPSGIFGTTPINIPLSSYFSDVDYLDTYYNQSVEFNVSTSASSSIIRAESNSVGSRLSWNGTIDDWSLQLYGEEAGSENVTIIANDSLSEVSNGPFSIVFAAPSVTVITTPTSGGGTTTKLKHYSLKLIVPQDVIISERNYIDIPFSIQNNGQIDLSGITLSSFVEFDNVFSDEVTISLEDDYIDELKFGQSENFSMRILANTGRAGKYKAKIFANVTSPKFSDWAEFFIEIRKANESEAEQILIFTEKLVADNPECLELTELINRANEAFSLGEFSNAVRMAQEAIEACENSIEAGGQVRFGIDGFVEDNFYYISFATLVIFFMGFVFYIYKRVRFNKSGMDEYV
jgi:hypothetical protein